MLIKRDELINTEDEIKILENLLQQAIWKRRIILKKRQIQSWWDWLFEIIGY
jgi:hypothetical protein